MLTGKTTQEYKAERDAVMQAYYGNNKTTGMSKCCITLKNNCIIQMWILFITRFHY